MPRKSSKETDINVTATGAAPRRTPASKARSSRTVPAAAVEIPAPAEALVAAVGSVIGPSREEVAKLAFLYWEARGCTGGSPEEDWLRAERELRSLSSAATA
jgi:hypothetical protein